MLKIQYFLQYAAIPQGHLYAPKPVHSSAASHYSSPVTVKSSFRIPCRQTLACLRGQCRLSRPPCDNKHAMYSYISCSRISPENLVLKPPYELAIACLFHRTPCRQCKCFRCRHGPSVHNKIELHDTVEVPSSIRPFAFVHRGGFVS